MPSEHLRERFPLQSKLGPRDRLRDLVNHQLPGVTLKLLPSAPRQLPNLADNHYFRLVREGELWKQLENTSFLSINEKREALGYEPEEGGDQLYIGAGQLPIGEPDAGAIAGGPAPKDTGDQAGDQGKRRFRAYDGGRPRSQACGPPPRAPTGPA